MQPNKIEPEGGTPLQAKQIKFVDICKDLNEYFEYQQPKLIRLISEYIHFDELIPHYFLNRYNKETGHPRDYKLSSMLCALVIQKILCISETSIFLNVLSLSSELRELCGFTKIPHASQFTRLKKKFTKELNSFLNHLVDLTEPICKQIAPELSDILISDTTGIEAYVKENNPKFFETLLRNNKRFFKNNPNFNTHSYTCKQMPKDTYANKEIKLAYMNGHYCYSLKCSLITNGLGIIRHINFPDNDSDLFEFDDGNQAKDNYDSKTLIPTLDRYFNIHNDFNYKYFLGDAGFDSNDNYDYLYNTKGIIPVIPINPRNTKLLPVPGFTEDGIPTCPKDSSLLMKHDGTSKEKGRAARIKWLCPKVKKIRKNNKTQYILSCDNPCTDSKCGRVIQVPIKNNLRLHSVIPRNSEKWVSLYKIRTIIERTISTIKCTMGLQNIRIRDTKTLKSEILLCAITQQIILILASKINETKHPLAMRYLIA